MKTPVIAYSQSSRIAAAVLTTISRGSLLVLLALLMFFDTRLTNQLRLLRVFSSLCLAPGIAAWLLERAFAATVMIQGGALILQRRGQRIEIPCDAIDRVVPWVLPVPSGGLWLRLRSGRRFHYGLQVPDPIALIEALADAGAPEHVRAASQHPAAIYARSKNNASRRWYHPVLKFVVFALVPTLPLFRLHQWVAYGDTFGEYYTYGLKAYLLGFAIYWVTFTIYLVLYGAALRAVAESMVLATACVAPSSTATMRRAVEIALRILYYGGVPALLIRLFLSS
jgi:apolipoprotein N-acyltransferase